MNVRYLYCRTVTQVQLRETSLIKNRKHHCNYGNCRRSFSAIIFSAFMITIAVSSLLVEIFFTVSVIVYQFT